MIFIGLSEESKLIEIERYRDEHDIQKIVVINADEFPLIVAGADTVKYSDVIMYVTFYRLIQSITPDTLIVINECLRTQNRYDLTYNCIRNFLNLTTHRLIFQYFPQIDTRDDFMILFDFDTRSRWKRSGFDVELMRESKITIEPHPVTFNRVGVTTSPKTKARYQAERDELFKTIGNRDPHLIPRNLYLIGGVDKLAGLTPLFSAGQHVARNKRHGRDDVVTYEGVTRGGNYTIVEFPHRFIDFADFVFRTGQTNFDVLVADLKVDEWYFNRMKEWSERINDTYSSLS